MTGTANVSRMLFYYHAVTLVFLLWFAAYDHRHHRIRNASLLAFLPWCLLYIPAALTEAPACLVLLHCFLGFLCGFLLLLTVSFATGGGIGGRGHQAGGNPWHPLWGHRADGCSGCFLYPGPSAYGDAGHMPERKAQTDSVCTIHFLGQLFIHPAVAAPIIRKGETHETDPVIFSWHTGCFIRHQCHRSSAYAGHIPFFRQ